MAQHVTRLRIEVNGIVQGIGYRPFVYGLAQELRLTGTVWNHSSGVTIEAEGPRSQLVDLVNRLRSKPPPLARIDDVTEFEIPIQNSTEFRIDASRKVSTASTPISADVAVCEECLVEMQDSENRRFRYPFINCTNCGPRFTITCDTPYDRSQTTMTSFEMCSLCDAEYRDPSNRRFHAEPNACPNCGPQVCFASREMLTADPETFSGYGGPGDTPAIDLFHAAISAGQIVAVKGTGGFHLACDASRDDAIAELRRRKRRRDKPFAVMVPDLAAARRIALLSPEEERLLTSHARPIVLLRRRANANHLSALVAPGSDSVGIMLPESPLHHLLLEPGTALVMTSGNVSGEPIVRTNQEALSRLDGLADAFLLHDREIHVVCDDSVVRVFDGHELPVRRSRGYAPLPVRLTCTGPSVLAVGGELKATFCVTKDDYAYMSQHIGDMSNLETLQAFQRSVAHFRNLFRVQPQAIACDMHPGYLSKAWAETYARDAGIPIIEVQHHHAHIAAIRTEHRCHEPVIGICFDGTGYGTDGAIWGGEVLHVTDAGFTRLAHLKYIPLPGGDISIQRPYRAALAHLWAADLPWDEALPCVAACPVAERTILRTQLERSLNCVPTSSLGRLFDAVASMIGVRHLVAYEAQAAMELEALAMGTDHIESYPIRLTDAVPIQIDPQPLLHAIVTDLQQGVAVAIVAGRFHATLADVVSDLCQRVRDELGIGTVALSGGVFQNVLLLNWTIRRLERHGFRVLAHRQVPPNDGGIALGQAQIARNLITAAQPAQNSV